MLLALCLGLSAPAWGLDVAVPYVGGDFLRGLGYTGTGLEIGVIDLATADSTHPAIHGNYRGSLNFVKGPCS